MIDKKLIKYNEIDISVKTMYYRIGNIILGYFWAWVIMYAYNLVFLAFSVLPDEEIMGIFVPEFTAYLTTFVVSGYFILRHLVVIIYEYKKLRGDKSIVFEEQSNIER